ncbi:polysaccharide deacetylase family protein [Candidatus Margulisiibacteriota bacterium]
MQKKYLASLLLILLILPMASATAKHTTKAEPAQVVWRGDREQPQVALTFDDGPKPEFCLPILNILDQYGIKATFFVIGREARWHPDLIYRMSESGHDIGNHTYTHYRLDSLSREQVNVELAATNEIIKSITGKTPIYFRPPGGRFNRIVLEEVKNRGLQVINWSLNTGDYTKASKYFRPTMKANDIVNNVVDNCQNGDIILMHNGGGPTAEALPKIIRSLRAKGFKLVTISQLLKKTVPNLFVAVPD